MEVWDEGGVNTYRCNIEYTSKIKVTFQKDKSAEEYHKTLDSYKMSIESDMHKLAYFAACPCQQSFDGVQIAMCIHSLQNMQMPPGPAQFDETKDIEPGLDFMEMITWRELVNAQAVGSMISEDVYEWCEKEVIIPAVSCCSNEQEKERAKDALYRVLDKAKNTEIEIIFAEKVWDCVLISKRKSETEEEE